MRLFTDLKVSSRDYTVEYIKGLADSGSTDTVLQKVLIKDELSNDNKFSTTIHEVLEIINDQYDLQLSHQTIQTLEVALFGFLKDNNIV